MTDAVKPASRRTILLGIAGLTGASALVQSQGAVAAGGVTQANAKYQPNPKGAQQCSKCNYFLPGAKADGPGQCKVVSGAISPNGWCQLFAAKHA